MSVGAKRGAHDRKPMLEVRVILGKTTSHAFVSVVGSRADTRLRDSAGGLGLRVGVDDLVGRPATSAALKVLHHVVRTLEHLEHDRRTAGGPGTPGGGHGGGSEGAWQQVMEFSDASCRELVLGHQRVSHASVVSGRSVPPGVLTGLLPSKTDDQRS